MITVLTRRYGKISAGTSINEGGKNKSALALRPFSYGRYDIFKNKDNYNINGAEIIQSFFSIGEDVDRYIGASYGLELADRVLEEGQPSPAFFSLLLDFMSCIEKRKKAYGTLIIAYQLKILALSGCAPVLDQCARCGHTLLPSNGGSANGISAFSVEDGGIICQSCRTERDDLNPLVFPASDTLVQVLSFMESHSLQSLENLALDPSTQAQASRIMKAYISHHLGVSNLKCEDINY